MKKKIFKPINLFVILVLVIALPLFLLPINLFEGEITYQSGISTIVEPRPLSLHFVSGIEYYGTKIKGVKDYYLTNKGYLFAFLFIFGLPAIIAYRVKINQVKKANQ